MIPGAEAGGLNAARAAAAQRRSLSGKGGGLWTGSGPTVDMPPMTQAAVTAFVLEEVVPAALKCLVDGAPRGLDLRDAMAVSATVHMGALFKEARAASGGAAGFVGSAALACSCTPQVGGGEGAGVRRRWDFVLSFFSASFFVCLVGWLVATPQL